MKLMNPEQKRRFKVGVLSLIGNILDERNEAIPIRTEQNPYHSGYNIEYQNMDSNIIYSTTPSSLSSPSTSMPISPPLDLVQQSTSLQLNQNNPQNWSYK